MRTKGRRKSTNVEDRRRMTPAKGVMGGGIGLIVMVGIAMLLGVDPSAILQQASQGGGPSTRIDRPLTEAEKAASDFISVVLADTEDVWNELFREMGRTYKEPTLVLFSNDVSSACGHASAAMGPFYCPPDQQIYIDLRFFDELKKRFRVPGDFPQAYVLAHEVGHHVQTLLGISQKMRARQRGASQAEKNRLSVRLELQADFYAGVWAHHAERTKGVLEAGDIAEAIRAAEAIGDDTIQRQTQGQVVPDSFTHGTSAQRIAWFQYGFETGDWTRGDTFNDEIFHRVNPR